MYNCDRFIQQFILMQTLEGMNVNTKKLFSEFFLPNKKQNRHFKVSSEKVTVRSFDGLTLSGQLVAASSAKRILIAMHSYKSDPVSDFRNISDFLMQAGCTVLYADQRAHGESDGDIISFGINERYDCISWLKYVTENISSDMPVYFYGIGMGACCALMADSKQITSNLHGIIADSPFISPDEMLAYNLNKKTGSSEKLQETDKMLMKKYGFSLYDYSVPEALKSLSRPVLLLHDAKKNKAPLEMTEKLFDMYKGEKELSVFKNNEELTDALGSFFTEYDKAVFSNEIHLHYPEKTMFELVKEAAERLPDDAAYNFEGKITSYRKMLQRIEKTARSFINIGIRRNDVVTLCMPNTPQAVDSLYALNRIGAVASFIHPLSAVKEISYYLNLSKSKAIVVPDLFYENVMNALKEVKQAVQVIVVRIQDELTPVLYAAYTLKKGKDYLKFPDSRGGTKWKDFIANGSAVNELPPIIFDKNKTAVILYSGGTTGVSKGICLSDLNFNALAMQARISMNCEFSRGLKNLSAMPIFHGFGLGIGIHTVLINNACCILLAQFNTKIYASAMKKRKPNFIAGVPTIFKMLVECKDMKNEDLSYLKGMFVGGDSMPVELKKTVDTFLKNHNADIQVREGYGLTECVTASCLTPKDTHKEGSIGLPFPDTYYKIVSLETGEELPKGEEGEIVISGPSVMLGYLDNEKETVVALRKHADGRIWLHTGDLGFIDEDGYIYFKQRIKRMIVTSGYNVYPSQVEKVIETHPAVDYCCVIGVRDDYKMEKIKAFIVTKDGNKEDDALREAIKIHCKKQIAGYAVPREIEFRKELPKTLVGKVAYRKLEEE